MENIKKKSPRYSPEVRERAVRMVHEHRGEHESQWKVIASIAAKMGCSGETLRNWVRQDERNRGLRADNSSADQQRGARQLQCPACCLKKECYSSDCCRFSFLSF